MIQYILQVDCWWLCNIAISIYSTLPFPTHYLKSSLNPMGYEVQMPLLGAFSKPQLRLRHSFWSSVYILSALSTLSTLFVRYVRYIRL